MGKETPPLDDLMNTREVAEYLRIKERKVYDLVRTKRIPCTRVTGKWLFPRRLIDQWLARGTEAPRQAEIPAPPVVAGSHDPLLEWALRESGCGLALLGGGSLNGLERMAAGEARMCGLHVYEPAEGDGGGDYNLGSVGGAFAGRDVVLVHWAWRDQGLVVAPGNPLGIAALTDLGAGKVRVAVRQFDAGSRILFDHLLGRAGIDAADLDILDPPLLSEIDLGLAVLEGKADAGLAVAAAAHQLRLDFVPLHRERYDLLVGRRDYFEAPVQKLLAFAGTEAFRERAREMGGYDVSGLGEVVWNGP